MMSSTEDLAYASGDGWRAVELPYAGNALSMLLVLPSDLDAFLEETDADGFAAIVCGLSSREVELSMPRFSIESQADLRDLLSAMGMPTAFSKGADFSGMTQAERLRISKVIHQANIDVDEDGTEAAAATAVVVEVESRPATKATLRLDRPFLFALRDVETGTIIFLGQVADPSAS